MFQGKRILQITPPVPIDPLLVLKKIYFRSILDKRITRLCEINVSNHKHLHQKCHIGGKSALSLLRLIMVWNQNISAWLFFFSILILDFLAEPYEIAQFQWANNLPFPFFHTCSHRTMESSSKSPLICPGTLDQGIKTGQVKKISKFSWILYPCTVEPHLE